MFDNRYVVHTRAGSEAFDPSRQEISDLVAFLTSIDETTATFPEAWERDLCGGY